MARGFLFLGFLSGVTAFRVGLSAPFSSGSSSLRTLRMMSTSVSQVETPALLLCMDSFEKNLIRMQKAVDSMKSESGGTLNLRPHAKCHKSSQLANLQLDAGAVGLCAAKLTELEVLVAGGVNDIILTNQIVHQEKIKRIAKLLAKDANVTIGVCVDNPVNAKLLSDIVAEETNDRKLDAYIEVDVGQKRCGVAPGIPCADLAERIIHDCPSLNLKGIQAYSGWNQHIQTLEARAEQTGVVVAKVQECLVAMKEKGVMPSDGLVITGGGTGTFTLEGASGVYTEVQPGSYCVMDGEYGKTEPCDDNRHYENAMYVLATVVSDSTSHPDWVVVDAGDKAVHGGAVGITVMGPGFNPATGPGGGCSGLTYRRGGDEHGIIEGPREVLDAMPIGSLVYLIPGHCDPTINMYSEFTACRVQDQGLVVERLIPIEGRGPGV